MSWIVLGVITFTLGFTFLVAASRRVELTRMAQTVRRREEAEHKGIAQALLQHPVVDLTRCLGCGTCVTSCPEDGVLELVHGQAMVVRGARCRGHSACERECPVGAITVTLSNLEERDDVPNVTEGLEAVGSPGLFLAGEVTAHTLIKTAVDHGVAVGAEVARRVEEDEAVDREVLDLCVVGAGPAGFACSLEAKRNGLDFVTLDQETDLGGTVAKYPRRKVVMTQPIELPLYGRFKSAEYTKEEMIDVWRKVAAEHELPIRGGEIFRELVRDEKGNYVVRTETGAYTARNVCLALGRRGTPAKLGVPGEELPKVAYSLLDASSYQGRRILVVGGGDSAVEAAMGLAEQPGNEVTLSYRREAFVRVRERNERRLAEVLGQRKLRVLFKSEVVAIRPAAVDLTVESKRGKETTTLQNDDVFVLIGGTPPFELLRNAGVSFDPTLRDAPQVVGEQGTGLMKAMGAGFVLSLSALIWALAHLDYYGLPETHRAAHPKHALLRPDLGAGLWLGVAAAGLICVNLTYLLRRSPRFRLSFGSLQTWMTGHVATGILALLAAMLHGAMSPQATPGGRAFWALVVLLITGAIGRYFYAYVPRAANGRELELAEVKSRLGSMSGEWDQGQQRFREHARQEVTALIEAKQWKATFLGRVLALAGVQRDLHRLTQRLRRAGRREGVAEFQIQETIRLARRAHRTALMAAHYEDLRGVLNTWRFVHRWVAALLVLLIVVHVIYAFTYGSLLFDGGRE